MEHYAAYLLKLKYDGYIVLQRNRVQNDTLHKQDVVKISLWE